MSPAPCGRLLLGFRKRPCLLLTVRWPVLFVSSGPISLSLKVGLEVVWATGRRLPPPPRTLKTLGKLVAGREPECDWRGSQSAGVMTPSVWLALGDQTKPLLPWAIALGQRITREGRKKWRVTCHHRFPSRGQSSQQREMNLLRINNRGPDPERKSFSSCV